MQPAAVSIPTQAVMPQTEPQFKDKEAKHHQWIHWTTNPLIPECIQYTIIGHWTRSTSSDNHRSNLASIVEFLRNCESK